MPEDPQTDPGLPGDGRRGLLDVLAASVQGVFDLRTLPLPSADQVPGPLSSALNLLSDPRGSLLALRNGAITAARRWTDALLTRGADLKVPGRPDLRIGDAVNLTMVSHVWPGRASRLYRIDPNGGVGPPSHRFQRELPITREQVEADDRPVALILHGFCSSTTSWHFEPLKMWLTEPLTDRYGLVLAFECDTVQRRLPALADDLREQLRQVGLLTGTRRLDIYAHSMGSVLARWLLENPESAASAEQKTIRRSVRRLIMAGPPNLGARLAELGDQLIRSLSKQNRFSDAELTTASAAFRMPLVAALAKHFTVKVPTARTLSQGINDLMPGSEVLTALRAQSGSVPDLPAYYLIQGMYDPIPPGETVAVRLLREAVSRLGDFDPRQSDLIVDGKSQMGFKPLLGDPLQSWPPQHIVLSQTWHHQYWSDPSTFERIRVALLDSLPK